jgi:hypothetical protein
LITALIKRRFCLWQNRLIPSVFILLLLPIFVFAMIGVPLKNVLRYSLSGMSYDIWVFPGLIFILGSLSLYPLLYREFFDLRIHRKVLINIALTPHTKNRIVFASLVAACMEALVVSSIGAIFYTGFIPIVLTLPNLLFLLCCLMIYLMLLGNLFISISLLIDTITTMSLVIFMVFLFIVFGNGFLIEFSFFPLGFESFLKWQPLSLPFQSYQMFNATGMIDWPAMVLLVPVIYFWIIFNGYILKQKLRQ